MSSIIFYFFSINFIQFKPYDIAIITTISSF
nr:MAG TPA: hypothetical protein [Caudoviricetes sp.]